jgi:hypothetical protein
MESGARDFTDREKAREGGLTAEVCGDAATEVMGSGNDRSRFLGEIEAGLEAGGVDVREAFGKVALGHLSGVE